MFDPTETNHLDQAAGFEDVLEIIHWYQHQNLYEVDAGDYRPPD